MTPTVPADIGGSGDAGPALKAALGGRTSVSGWVAGGRRLLHGEPRKPRTYARCPNCTLLWCGRTGLGRRCTGHCRSRLQLRQCARPSPGVVCNDTFTPDTSSDVPIREPIDPIGLAQRVAVAATAPFIGCANIADLPTGCPPSGTSGSTGGPYSRTYRVTETECNQFAYDVECDVGAHRTPLFPFGYCQCTVEYSDASVSTAPCRLSELSYSGLPALSSGEVPITVVPDGNTTLTTFGVQDSRQLAVFEFSTSFSQGKETVDTGMGIWYPPLVGFDSDVGPVVLDHGVAPTTPSGPSSGIPSTPPALRSSISPTTEGSGRGATPDQSPPAQPAMSYRYR